MTTRPITARNDEPAQEFVTVKIHDQLFGVSVYNVQDVLVHHKVTTIPLAPPEVVGSINLRGRIVTVIDLRTCLGLSPLPEAASRKSIVVDRKGDLYSLMVDAVGDVLTLPLSGLANNPHNMTPFWQRVSKGVFTLEDQILIILNVEKLLDFSSRTFTEVAHENMPGS